MREGLEPKKIHKMLESLNHLELLDSWFIENLLKTSDMLIKSENARDEEDRKPTVFGGKKNLLRRQKNLISKEEWKELRLGTMNVVGEANKKGNRKFRIEEDLKHIKFKPFRKNDVIYLKLPMLKKRH